jgi:hypothetical protein
MANTKLPVNAVSRTPRADIRDHQGASGLYPSCKTPRVVRQKNTVISPARLGTKDDCAGEGQQQFTRPKDRLAGLLLHLHCDSVGYCRYRWAQLNLRRGHVRRRDIFDVLERLARNVWMSGVCRMEQRILMMNHKRSSRTWSWFMTLCLYTPRDWGKPRILSLRIAEILSKYGTCCHSTAIFVVIWARTLTCLCHQVSWISVGFQYGKW